MTIGLCASGPKAGLAVFTALRTVEGVGWGSIGGFVAFAALDGDGLLHEFETSRGGTRTLFIEGEQTGVGPPEPIAHAPLAAVISSGPDRPLPLKRFISADPSAGLVAGHRLPYWESVGGMALNEEVLAAMRAGRFAREAVDLALDANPEADAGLIALDLSGAIYARNSERVRRRPDLGHARREDRVVGAVVEVLHNSILPGPSIAALAADMALQTMVPRGEPDGWVTIEAGTILEYGPEAAVLVDDGLVVRKVLTTDQALLSERKNGAAIYLGAIVRQKRKVLGRTIVEPNVTVESGRIVSMSGQTRLRLGYRRD